MAKKQKKSFLNVNLPVFILREGKSFVAYTPVLDLSTCGKTFEEAKKRFSEAVSIFFEELIKKNTIDEALSELGWKKVKARWSPPSVIAHESEEFKVPAVA